MSILTDKNKNKNENKNKNKNKNKNIYYANYWSNDTTLILYELNGENLFSDLKLKLSLIKTDNNAIIELSTIELPECRSCFGIISNLELNEFTVVSNEYLNNDPIIRLQYFTINEHNNIIFTNELIIKTEYSCGNTNGKICKIDNFAFNIIWGDLSNYDYCDIFTIANKQIVSKEQIKLYDIDCDLDSCYFVSKCTIFKSLASGINNDKINIAVQLIDDSVQLNQPNQTNKSNQPNQPNQTNKSTQPKLPDAKFIFSFLSFKLPNGLTHNCSQLSEIESTIIDFAKPADNKKIYFLIRLKLDERINVLHIEPYTIDILIEIVSQKILFVTNKTKFYENKYLNSSIQYKLIENKETEKTDKNKQIDTLEPYVFTFV